jgi:hypothetical protein
VTDVRILRGAGVDATEQLGQRIREIGEQRLLQRRGHIRQRRRLVGNAQHHGRRGADDRRAMGTGRDQFDLESGIPGQPPHLAERPLRPSLVGGRHTPVHTEDSQSVQQSRLLQVVRLPQVELDHSLGRVPPHPEPPCLSGQIRRDRSLRRLTRHRPQQLPDHGFTRDKVKQYVVSAAQDRPRRLGDLAQPGQRTFPQRGQGVREPDGFDHVRAGDRQILFPQDPRDLRQPPGGDLVRRGEQVVVPTG